MSDYCDSAMIERTIYARIAVLIPCYNEALTISKVVRDFRQALPEAVVYVYDNNSCDRTCDVARTAGAVIGFETTQGKATSFAVCLPMLRPTFTSSSTATIHTMPLPRPGSFPSFSTTSSTW